MYVEYCESHSRAQLDNLYLDYVLHGPIVACDACQAIVCLSAHSLVGSSVVTEMNLLWESMISFVHVITGSGVFNASESENREN